jgi:hypothetical protein
MLYPAPLHGFAPDLHSTTASAVLYSGTELGGQELPRVEQLVMGALAPDLVATGKEGGQAVTLEARHSVSVVLEKALMLNAACAHWHTPPTATELGIALQSTCDCRCDCNCAAAQQLHGRSKTQPEMGGWLTKRHHAASK